MRHTESGGRRELRLADTAGPVLITGGAGFVGTNVAHALLSAGTPVVVLDNLSRPGVDRNLRWLRETHGPLLRIEYADVRDRVAVQRAVRNARRVIHLAAQVAVTTSMRDPVHDFEVNARGTLNVLGAIHSLNDPPPLLFTSTNKVYGGLEDVPLRPGVRRYEPVDDTTRARGIDETRLLDFHSPYGCSKGAADQYVLDFARTFGIRAAVFRMSCIYGPHQYGNEDQGWVAHFLIRALGGAPITLYGDGRQVRDILYVDDLVRAIDLAFVHMDAASGQAFNIGGGPGNTTSLLELAELIGELTGSDPGVRLDGWRPGDQRYYVSDPSRFTALTGWRPRVGIVEGVRRLHTWLADNAVTDIPPDSAGFAEMIAAGAPAAVGE